MKSLSAVKSLLSAKVKSDRSRAKVMPRIIKVKSAFCGLNHFVMKSLLSRKDEIRPQSGESDASYY